MCNLHIIYLNSFIRQQLQYPYMSNSDAALDKKRCNVAKPGFQLVNITNGHNSTKNA